MSIDEFKRYPHFQQWYIAKDLGKLIFSKTTPNHQINIYHVFDFFVESWENLNTQMLDSLITYQNTQLLEKYADEIDLDDLYD